MSGKYASETKVPVAKSREEIQATLERYGATGFGFMTQGSASIVVFEINDVRVMFRVRIPSEHDREIAYNGRGYSRSEQARKDRLAQVERQRWRALLLVIKAKLESIDLGIETFEEAFLSHIVVPSTGQTYGEMAIPALTSVYQHNELPPLVPSTGTNVIALGERSSS